MIERLSAVKDGRLVEWLSNRLKQRSDWAGALDLETRLFWEYPNIEKYVGLRKLGRQLNRWDNLRAHLIAELERRKNYGVLIHLHLLEKEVEAAISALEKLPLHWRDHMLPIEVARAAKKEYPQEALRLFSNEAERFIEERNRDSYSQAAQCLREERGIYRQLKDVQAWNKLIADIRERYRRLPALQDELNRLKL